MTTQLIYNIVFEGKCEEHLFFKNINVLFKKALIEWSNIGQSNIKISDYKMKIVMEINEERKSYVERIQDYKTYVKSNNLVYEFNINKILEKITFVSADALHGKSKHNMTLLEKEFYDFIDSFIEEIEYKIVRQYNLLCIKEKRFDQIPIIQHVVFNR